MQNKLLLIGLLFTITSVGTASNSEVSINSGDQKIMETIIEQVKKDISVDDDFNAWELFDWLDKEKQRRFVIQKALEYIHANNALETTTAINTAYDELEEKMIQKIDAMEKTDFIDEEKIKDEASKYINYLDADNRVRQNATISRSSEENSVNTDDKPAEIENSETENYTTIKDNFNDFNSENQNTNDNKSETDFTVDYDNESKISEGTDLNELTKYNQNPNGDWDKELNFYNRNDKDDQNDKIDNEIAESMQEGSEAMNKKNNYSWENDTLSYDKKDDIKKYEKQNDVTEKEEKIKGDEQVRNFAYNNERDYLNDKNTDEDLVLSHSSYNKVDLSNKQIEDDKTHFSSYDYNYGTLQSENIDNNKSNKLNDENNYEYTGTSNLTDTTENKSGYYNDDSNDNDNYSLYRHENSKYSSKIDDTVISNNTNSGYGENNPEIEKNTLDYSNSDFLYMKNNKNSYIDNSNDYESSYSENNSNIDDNKYMSYNSKTGSREYTTQKNKSNSEKLKEVKNDLNKIDIK